MDGALINTASSVKLNQVDDTSLNITLYQISTVTKVPMYIPSNQCFPPIDEGLGQVKNDVG